VTWLRALWLFLFVMPVALFRVLLHLIQHPACDERCVWQRKIRGLE
jgi:hypothetical protein